MARVWASAPIPGVLTFRPSDEPTVLPPNSSIPSELYNDLLSPKWPLSFALMYAVTVTALNRVNASRQYKPWAFSRIRLFKFLVLLHNLLLAAYSAWTFVGMFNAVRNSFPGFKGEHGLPGAVDALCQLHGPRGFGDAAIYNTSLSRWTLSSPYVHLDEANLPDRTDVGRIWNEGLAFYGWIFYISKYYEVVDTAVILAKGKRSSLLQTYHHAGAMLCMWAGIRFMAAPIWMFVLVNSFIHTLMYTYYNLAALAVPIPKAMKQTLTTLQIIQFIVGSVYAALHLFISYTFPVTKEVEISQSASSVVESATSVISIEATGIGSWFRALAQSIVASETKPTGALSETVMPSPTAWAKPEIVLETSYQATACVTNSGQAFAIWLNILYLAPLTWLFVKFFINAYTTRSDVKRSHSQSQSVNKTSNLEVKMGNGHSESKSALK